MPRPTYETSRLVLHPLGESDRDSLHAIFVDPGVRRYLWDDQVIPPTQTDEIVARNGEMFDALGYGLWGCRLRKKSALIGFCGFWHFREPPELELLYGVATPFWGRGIATEIAGTMIRLGFQEFGFRQIVASADASNIGSIRVLEKCKMKRDRRVTVNGRDTIFYTITRASFENSTKKMPT